MTPKDKAGGESDAERFEKNLAALMAVPRSEIEAVEPKRPKRKVTRKQPKR